MARRPPEPEPAEEGLSRLLEICSFLIVLATFPFSLFFTLKITKEYERVVIFRLGRSLGRARGPGLFFFLPCLDRCCVVDLRTRTYTVPRQEVYTLDGVTVHVSAVLNYRVVEARLAVTAVEDCHASTQLLASTVLRSEVGRRSLSVLLEDRQGLAGDIKDQFSETTPAWGVQVERLELRDLGIDPGLQRCMAVESTTYRQFRAQNIRAAAANGTASLVIPDSATEHKELTFKTKHMVECDKCDYKCKTEAKLKKHKKSKHKAICSICYREFDCGSELEGVCLRMCLLCMIRRSQGRPC